MVVLSLRFISSMATQSTCKIMSPGTCCVKEVNLTPPYYYTNEVWNTATLINNNDGNLRLSNMFTAQEDVCYKSFDQYFGERYFLYSKNAWSFYSDSGCYFQLSGPQVNFFLLNQNVQNVLCDGPSGVCQYTYNKN
mmetsp:Transcript_33809/g.52902  ORF Transcript_33809/g.52902 Transcript_33809/m.52902 type:complete len:136 (-) Transcript_33809:54-461(-)